MTLSVTIDATGIHAPSYADVLNALKAQYRAIYGPDVYLENDSQDGQWLAVLAKCIHDANSAAISVYHAFSPATAQGQNQRHPPPDCNRFNGRCAIDRTGGDNDSKRRGSGRKPDSMGFAGAGGHSAVG